MTDLNNADDHSFGTGDFDEDILCWSPTHSLITQMTKFRHVINKKYSLKLETYEELWQWSIKEYDSFWEEVWHFSGVTYSKPFAVVVDKSKSIAEIPEWFTGARLNYAENLLRDNSDRIALYSTGERISGEPEKCTFKELRQHVAQYAAAMRAMGVKCNDRVVGYIPNCAEAIVAMLAAASIGAVWSSTSPDFGVHGVLDRFTQIQPKLIFSVDAVMYNSKVHNHIDKLHNVVSGLPELEKVVVIHFVGTKQDISIIPKSVYLDEFLLDGINADGSIPKLTFEQLPFNHPLFIMYSSGTTGVPKCMVHSAGGTLLQLWKEHVLGGNMTDKDVLLYYTTTGWMMWNWMVSALAIGATLVLYDGSPLVPTPYVLWDLIDQLNITVLGTSAKWIALLEDKKVHPKQSHNLKSLHSILSTGSPLKPKSFDYVYENIKKNVLLGSITGGTDIISCFAGWNWTVPVYRGEIQCRNLGMAVECYDDSGKPVYGKRGDLVCTKPFPSMPTHFWNDPTGSRYRKSYFETFPGVWTHGDFCLINKRTGGLWMLGRSDGTLNPSGVRFGSSEIYNIVESYKEIDDSLCIGQQNDKGEERVILFVKMTSGHPFTQDLVKRLKAGIRTELSVRHVPSLILETKDIPYTTNSKKVEVAVKQIISGLEVQNKGALANPDSLELYRDIPELQNW